MTPGETLTSTFRWLRLPRWYGAPTSRSRRRIRTQRVFAATLPRRRGMAERLRPHPTTADMDRVGRVARHLAADDPVLPGASQLLLDVRAHRPLPAECPA